MSGRFALFTDNHIRQQIVDTLSGHGWDVVRAIDTFPEKTPDEVLFEHAARTQRVIVTNDQKMHAVAKAWLSRGRPFRMVFWPHERYRSMSEGDFLNAFERLARRPDPFAYPIEYVKPE